MSRFFGAGESEALLSNEALRSPSAASPTKLISIHNTYIDIRIDIYNRYRYGYRYGYRYEYSIKNI